MGVLHKYDVELIGANRASIEMAEDRKLFREAMDRIGLENPRATIATNMEECMAALEDVGLPAIIRPAYTLGGTGGVSPIIAKTMSTTAAPVSMPRRSARS